VSKETRIVSKETRRFIRCLRERERERERERKKERERERKRDLHGDPRAERAGAHTPFAVDLDLLGHVAMAVLGLEDAQLLHPRLPVHVQLPREAH